MKQAKFEHKARKRFGQNFLVDPGIIQMIARSISPRANDHLVEIGPGQGAITGLLVDSCEKLDVIELDRHSWKFALQHFHTFDILSSEF